SPDEETLGSDNLKRDLKKVGVGNVEEFCSELKEWAKGRDDLTSRLFSKFRTDSRGKKVLEVLEKHGLLKRGVSIEEERAMPPAGETGEKESEETARLPKMPEPLERTEKEKPVRRDRLTWVSIHNEIGGDAIKIINTLRALERKGLIEARETGGNREYMPKRDIEKLREKVELDEFEERVLSSIIRWRMREEKPTAYFDGGMEMLKEVITGEIHDPYRKTLKEIKKNVEGRGK
ncbi:MAG: hypothetical protein B6U86_02565, partial [Candidatus Altiarchaeales archaeon ex4484_43]